MRKKICLAVLGFKMASLVIFLSTGLLVSSIVMSLSALLWVYRGYRFHEADQGEEATISFGSDSGSYKPIQTGTITSFV